MDPKIAELVGLLRHQIISPVLMETGRGQMSYFREVATREWDVPGRGPRRFGAMTMKGWLNRYNKNGFKALVPKIREDQGGFRKISSSQKETLSKLRKNYLFLSVVQFYDVAKNYNALGSPPICMATLRRFLKHENLFAEKESITARKRFSMSRFGELWTGDFMHGPHVFTDLSKKKQKKAILMAIIDDHSRMIVSGVFGFQENTRLLEQSFKEAILSYGLPDRLYVDNGPSFSSEYLKRVCAHLKIGLVHSKPYDSPSRGKIERFFRTVRQQFLVTIHPGAEITLDDLNTQFQRWLRTEYHHRPHAGIKHRPIDLLQTSTALYPLKKIDEESLGEFFMASVERTVSNDCVVSFQAIQYETPPSYVGRRVELKFLQDKPNEIFLYDNGIRIQRLHPVDTMANGQTYRPSPRDTHVPFQSLINPKEEYES
jgi:transposase InsO family protein